jgi:hypothetical protein
MRMRSELLVGVLVEPECHPRAAHEDRPLDEVRLLHHQVDRFLLRLRERPLLEDRASRADEIQEPIGVDVLLEEGAIGRIAVDVPLLDVPVALLQKTSGVAARRSGRFPVEERLRHELIVPPGARNHLRLTSEPGDRRRRWYNSRFGRPC